MQDMAVNLIDEVFGSVGGVSQLVTIMHPILAAIDPATDTQISGEQSFIAYGVVGPWTKDSLGLQDNKTSVGGQPVKTNDQMLKVAYSNLEFIPTVDLDTVSIADGTVFLITHTEADSASAVMTMKLRRIKGTSYGYPF